MDASRSTRLIAVGAAALLVGTALTALAVRGADRASAAPADPPAAVAAAPETTAPVEPAPRIPETVEVPDGHEAVALQLPFDAGVAGLPSAGDHVNVYGVFGARQSEEGDRGPRVEAVLAGVEVLAITGPEIGAAGGSPTVVVAVTPDQTPRLIFLQAAERTWLTLTPPDGVAPATAAVDHGTVTR